MNLKYNFIFNISVFKPISFDEKPDLFNKSHENLYVTNEEKSSLAECMVMTVKMCNDFYEKKSLHNDIINYKDDYFPKKIAEIFTEVYVDKCYVSMCQHMIELYGKHFFSLAQFKTK